MLFYIIKQKSEEVLNMKKYIKRIAVILLLILSINVVECRNFVGAKSNGNKVINNNTIQEFMDNFFEKEMNKYKVSGATLLVVKDGKEVYKRGYGYSDVDERITVNPDKTLFPVASVSKLFTAIAIMQLYEQGKIDLNENVEKYITPYKIENDYNEVVTCANLLTHSSGIDEASEIDGNTRNDKAIKSQEYYFNNHIPRVVVKPNTISRYSNQGYNILGYVIEKVSGITYEEYIKKYILEPLRMNDSLVRLKNSDTAIGYEYIDGVFKEVPLAYQYTSGSSGIIVTTRDMENFITAILNNGEINNTRILKESTMKLMKEKQFSNNKALSGMGYGFIRSNRNGKEIVKHEGALPGFTSTMFLIEDENLGIYVSTNSLNPLPFDIEQEFLNSFYPKDNSKYNNTKANINKDYSDFEGTYRSYDGISKSNIMKIGILFDRTMDLTIKDNKDGTLTLKEYTNAKEKNVTKLKENSEGVFVREDGKGDFAFKFDSNNKVIYAFNDISHNSYEKIKFYEGRIFNIVVILSTILVFVLNVFITLSRVLRKNRKRYKKNIEILIISDLIISIFNIVGFIGALVMAVFMISTNNFSHLLFLKILLCLLIVSTLLSIVTVINTVSVLIKKGCTNKQKLYFYILSVSNLVFVGIIYYYNFLGINL